MNTKMEENQWFFNELMANCSFVTIAAQCHKTAVEKGWFDEGELSPSQIAEKLCLVHSEVSEALEDVRRGNMELHFEEDGKPVGYPSEIADILIRVLDLAVHMKVDLEKAMATKMCYNTTRPYKHGNKKF